MLDSFKVIFVGSEFRFEYLRPTPKASLSLVFCLTTYMMARVRLFIGSLRVYSETSRLPTPKLARAQTWDD